MILESSFFPEWDNDRVARAERDCACRTFQVVLTADSEIPMVRYMQGIGSADRHPGHSWAEALDEMKPRLRTEFVPLKITGATMVVDTTDPDRVEYAEILSRIRSLIRRPA